MKKLFSLRRDFDRLAGSFIFLIAIIALPAVSFGSTVGDCFKTASGYNAFTTGLTDAKAAVTLAVEHPECVPPIISMDTSFEALTAGMILAKEAGVFSSEGQCKSAVSGPAKKAVAGFLKQSMGAILPSGSLATLQSIADGKSDEALSSIPVLGQLLSQLPCACTVAYSGLSIAELREIITKEAKGIKACGSLISGAVATMEEGMEALGDAVGLSCDHPKINEVEYYQKYLAPVLDKYAVATDYERHKGCYESACGSACMNYYTSGSGACRMKKGNAQHLCFDVILPQFDQKVMARQPVLVAQALAECTAMGDGCVMNKDYPKMVIDAYGQDTLSSCLGLLKNTYKTTGCKPSEQPCCWRAPWPPALKCKKARADAASKLGNLGSQIGQSFNNLPTTNADAQTIADRQACQQKIIGNALYYLQEAACEAAMKTPTDDYSGIWPAVLKAAKESGLGDAYTKCDGPYNRHVKIIGCKNKCANAATLQAVYGNSGPGASNQCYNDCISGALVGKMSNPGLQQAQSQQQASCVAQCKITCDNAPTSVPCQNCKKPNACSTSGSSSGSGSGSGSSSSGSAKPKVGSGSGGVLQ
ncbi:MAG: hypothetical protein CVU55_14495 [Deltaproteobacteria bacterium HGW-Deltaproteobacteria-13]|jgi:hypothetical protein|nr:MAG: hypothetical protein CVU55_14495 [Deltaproteobacteria bacterium HGW-Deltaproteobacteria-13]